MGMYDSCPCKGCEPPKRHCKCHGHCEDKLVWDNKLKATKEAIARDKEQHYQATGFLADNAAKTVHRLRRRGIKR